MINNDLKFLQIYNTLLKKLPTYIKVTEEDIDIHRLTPFKTNSRAKVAFVALTHGDEVIGLHIFIKLLKSLCEGELTLEGELILILANSPAYIKNQRFVQVDLNRSYGQSDNRTLEGARVSAIKPIVSECDFIIDIHQCIEETLHPFFILPVSTEPNNSHLWIENVAPKVPIILRRGIDLATTLSSYGFLLGKKSVTFEVGASGYDSKQLDFGFDIIKSFLNFAWQNRGSNMINNNRLNNPLYEIKYHQVYAGGTMKFYKSFKNFETVLQGQIIAYIDETAVRSPISGKILLYPKKWFSKDSNVKPDGIFMVLQKF